MRKVSPVLLSLVIFLQACSALPFSLGQQVDISTPAATRTHVATYTPGAQPTATLTPTITPSPTIIHFPTQDPNMPTATFEAIPIYVGDNTATPTLAAVEAPLATISRPGAGFESVQVSEEKIFWGGCKPNKAKVTVRVEDPKGVFSVYIFVQLRSTLKEDYTPWSTGDVMFNYHDGSFSYILQGNEIEGHNNYLSSSIRFQLVATDAAGREVARSIIYQIVGLSPCL